MQLSSFSTLFDLAFTCSSFIRMRRARCRQRLLPGLCVYCCTQIVPAHATTPEEMEQLLSMDLAQLSEIRVVSSTKRPEPARKVPAVVSVVTAAQIARYGYASLAEILAHSAGFVESFDGVFHNFGVRGVNAGVRASSRPFKVMINGQSVAFRSTGQNFLGPELIPVSLIEKVEIIRGPVSALYGADAFLGVVNVITRPGARNPLLEVGAGRTENSGQSWHWEASAGGESNHWRYDLGVDHALDDSGEQQLPRISPAFTTVAANRAESPAGTGDLHRPLAAFGQLSHPWDDGSVELAWHYQELDGEQPFTDINPLPRTGVSRVALRNGFLRLDGNHALSPGVQAHAFVSHASGAPLGEDRVDVGASDYYLKRDLGYDSLDYGVELAVDVSDMQHLLLGADYSRNQQTLETFIREDRISGAQLRLNPEREQLFTNTGVYGQWQIQLAHDWSGIVGYRQDHHSEYGTVRSGRVGIVLDLPASATLKLLAGSAFQAPSPELLYRDAVQAGDIAGNPDLRPQKARTLELSTNMPFKDAPVSTDVTLTLFRTVVDDLVTYETNFINQVARNGSSSVSRGLELELRLQHEAWDAYLNYAYQNTQRDTNPYSLLTLRQRDDGELFPHHGGSAGFSRLFANARWRCSLETRYVGERPASTQNVLYAQQFYALSAYWDTSFTAQKILAGPADAPTSLLVFQVRDLLDASHVDPGFGGIDFPSAGRRYSLAFQQRF